MRRIWLALVLAIASVLPGFAAAGCAKFVCHVPVVAAHSCCPDLAAKSVPDHKPAKPCPLCQLAPTAQKNPDSPVLVVFAVAVILPEKPAHFLTEAPLPTQPTEWPMVSLDTGPRVGTSQGPRAPPVV